MQVAIHLQRGKTDVHSVDVGDTVAHSEQRNQSEADFAKSFGNKIRPREIWVASLVHGCDTLSETYSKRQVTNTERTQSPQLPTNAAGDACFRWCRVARDFADHRSRPAHPSLP